MWYKQDSALERGIPNKWRKHSPGASYRRLTLGLQSKTINVFIMLHKLPSAGINFWNCQGTWYWNPFPECEMLWNDYKPGRSFLLCFSTSSNSQLTSEATTLLNSAKTVFMIRHFWLMLKISYCATLWWVNLGWLQATPSLLSSLAIQGEKMWWKAYGARKGQENHSPITTTGRLNLFMPINNRVG